MDFKEIMDKLPPGAAAGMKEKGHALQAQMMAFLAAKSKGLVRFVTTEAVNMEGIREYLQTNQSRVVSWNVVNDFSVQKFILLTEEIPNA